jgi:hypothetical protein
MSVARRALILVLFVIAADVAAPGVWARYEGNLNFMIGQKWLKDSEWSPVSEQPELAVLFAFAPERSPIYFAIDVMYSRDTQTMNTALYGDVVVEGTTQEYSIGIRKVWNGGGRSTQPFLGAGGCLVVSNLNLDSPVLAEHFGDQSYGVWVEGGITWRLGKHVNLGFELRYSTSAASFENSGPPIDVDAGGFHAGILIGYGW